MDPRVKSVTDMIAFLERHLKFYWEFLDILTDNNDTDATLSQIVDTRLKIFEIEDLIESENILLGTIQPID
jgi:GTP1/Obg family GTP-binding protein